MMMGQYLIEKGDRYYDEDKLVRATIFWLLAYLWDACAMTFIWVTLLVGFCMIFGDGEE